LKRQQAEKAAAEQAQVRASVTDPEARKMRQADGGFAPSYNAQISTDCRQGVIVGYDLIQSGEDSQELAAARERIEQNTGQAPKQLLVDGSYTTRQNILEAAQGPSELIGSLGENRSQAKLRSRGVSPEFFSDRFVFDAQQNQYTCPAGKILVSKTARSWWVRPRSVTRRAPVTARVARSGRGVVRGSNPGADWFFARKSTRKWRRFAPRCSAPSIGRFTGSGRRWPSFPTPA